MKRRVMFMVIPPLAIVIAWWLAIVGDRQDRFASADETSTEVRQAIAKTHHQVDTARAFAKRGEAATRELENLSAQIPDTMNLGDLVMANTLAAGIAGVSVTSFTPDPPGKTAAAAPVGLDVTGVDETVVGTADQITAYLNALRQLDHMDSMPQLARLVVVDRVEQTSQGQSTISMNVRLRVFAISHDPKNK